MRSLMVLLNFRGLLSMAVLFFSTSASAVNYYWVVYDWGTIGSSPYDACQKLVNERGWVGFTLHMDSDRIGLCTLNTQPGGYVRHAVALMGDSCPAGQVQLPGSTYVTCGCPEGKVMADGVCVAGGAEKGAPDKLACKGDPINILNGNEFEREVDFQAVGASNLSFSRAYNSIDGLWRHSYSSRIIVSGNSVLRVTEEGQEFSYVQNGSAFQGSPTDLGSLAKLDDGWSYKGPDDTISNFDGSGRLAQKISNFGRVQNLVYSGSTVTVTDQTGDSLSFSEDEMHQPLTLDAQGVAIQYGYNSNKRLVQVVRSQGGVSTSRSYHYEKVSNTSLLTGITDERGVRSSNWTYDDQGRATSSQRFGGVELTSVVYNADGSRKVTNELGKSTLYRFVETGGTKRVSAIEGEPSANCPASNSTYTYNDRGQVLTKTDAKGFITTHVYNDRGLETSRTEASGTPQARTTTTTWHATFNLPLTVTEGGQVTTYTYDAQGRQISRTQTAQ